MKITLFTFPNCQKAIKIKEFLNSNNILFEEILINNEEKRNEARKANQAPLTNVSFLKIIRSHSINIINGFNEFALNQLLEHIKKYQTKNMKPIIVFTSGYFDPLHIGHIELFEKAKKLGNKLIVAVNNDSQTLQKKGFVFMPAEEKVKIIKAIKWVDEVIISIDKDTTQCETLRLIKPDIFAKGGDRYVHEIPETPVCKELGIKIIDRLGSKIQSSTSLISKAEEAQNKKV